MVLYPRYLIEAEFRHAQNLHFGVPEEAVFRTQSILAIACDITTQAFLSESVVSPIPSWHVHQ